MLFTFTGCDPDGTGGTTGPGPNTGGPTVDFIDDVTNATLTFDSTVEPGQVFNIQVDATAGDSDLFTIEAFRDGFSLVASLDPAEDEFDILELDDTDEQNPALLLGDNATGFRWTYQFVAPQEELPYEYSFTVTDGEGLETTVALTITVFQTVPDTPPTLILNGPATLDSPAGSLVQINVEAVTGNNPIASVSVWEDGDLISDLTRIRFAGVDFEANPLPLMSPQSEGFTEGIIISTIAGDHDYVIRVTDTEENNSDVTFSILETSTGTPLSNQFDFVLFSNASGPDNGGLDLDNGVAVPSASADAEIRDLGIDTNQPAASNWIQQVEGVNGTDLRVVNISNLPDGFTFDGVTSKEQVTEAFNTGTPASPTPTLQVGDLLVASSFSAIYIMRVDEVNVTDNNNDDFYRFSIKF